MRHVSVCIHAPSKSPITNTCTPRNRRAGGPGQEKSYSTVAKIALTRATSVNDSELKRTSTPPLQDSRHYTPLPLRDLEHGGDRGVGSDGIGEGGG